MTTRSTREATAADTIEKARASATPPPLPPSAPPIAPPAADEVLFRFTVDVPQHRADRIKALAGEAARVRGWRRANVGDLLAALVERLADDPALQREVIAAMRPPAARRKAG